MTNTTIKATHRRAPLRSLAIIIAAMIIFINDPAVPLSAGDLPHSDDGKQGVFL